MYPHDRAFLAFNNTLYYNACVRFFSHIDQIHDVFPISPALLPARGPIIQFSFDANYLELEGIAGGSSGKESTCQCKKCGFNPWVGNIPWWRKWQSTPIFLPGNPVDRGAWQATAHGAAKSRARRPLLMMPLNHRAPPGRGGGAGEWVSCDLWKNYLLSRHKGVSNQRLAYCNLKRKGWI